MSDPDDQDLSGPFEALRAPRSTAGYAGREPRALAATAGSGRRWPQALAGALAVLVALTGAGTFLALRNARQDSTVSRAAGAPPARSDAAMAWDSTAGTTLMYGGTGASGTQLHDTWLWNGSAWRRAGGTGGPGPLVGAHMSDDPADGGVLLVGAPPVAMGTGGGAIGCVTGSAGAGSARGSAGAPGVATTAPPLRAPPIDSPVPSAVAVPAPSPCPAVVVTPSVQTWLYTAQGWQRPPAQPLAVEPALGAQLAYDGASHQVLAVATTYSPCGGPVASGSTKQPLMIPCEMLPASGAPSSVGSGAASSGTGLPTQQVCTVTGCATWDCPVAASSCNGGGRLSTWVWAGGHWTARPASGPTGAAAIAALSGAPGGAAELVAQRWAAVGGCMGLAVTCPVLPAATTPPLETWQWTGSSWQSTTSGLGPGSGLNLGETAVTGLDGVMVALGADGSTRTLDPRTARTARAGTGPRRAGAATAQGPSGTVVLFGGLALDTNPLGTGLLPGSDTWRWDGHSWTHVAGSEPPLQRLPSPCPTGKVCLVSPGVPSILPAPLNPPASAPAAPAPAPSVPAVIVSPPT